MDKSVFKCPECQERFSSRVLILDHLTKDHFMGSDQATQHCESSYIITHINDECICCTCGRVYTDPAAMAVHEARHKKRARDETDLAMVVYLPTTRRAKVVRNFDLNELPPPGERGEDCS